MHRATSVRPPSDDRAARRRLVWMLLRGDDLAGEELLSERASRRRPTPAHEAPAEDGNGTVTASR